MVEEETSPNLSRVGLVVPGLFLKHFDESIQGFFLCRSEAIRRGMNLVLKEIKKFKGTKQSEGTPTNQPNLGEDYQC